MVPIDNGKPYFTPLTTERLALPQNTALGTNRPKNAAGCYIQSRDELKYRLDGNNASPTEGIITIPRNSGSPVHEVWLTTGEAIRNFRAVKANGTGGDLTLDVQWFARAGG